MIVSTVTQPDIQTVEKKRSRSGPILTTVVVIAALGASFMYFQMKPSEEKKQQKKPVSPITVATASLANIPVELKSIGAVTPMNAVSVKSRVGGRIVKISFTEGQFVKKKDLLFTVDPRPLKAEYSIRESDVLKQEAVIAQSKAAIDKDKAMLEQVRATLKKDMALANLAEVNAVRFGALAKEGAVSEVEAERRETDRQSTAATILADKANIDNAKAQIVADQANLRNAIAQLASTKASLENARVQLNYTTVNSPISGRTGKILVLQGNNVRADEDVLVTINQIAPIYVEFSVPAEQFQQVQKYVNQDLYAEVDVNGDDVVRKGKVTFIDNTVDSTTGTVKMKAVFDNADSTLWPGKYVDVNLTLTVLKNAVTVPTQAVQMGQRGQFVWVVKNGQTAHMQLVKIGPAVNGLTAITSGIAAGDVVVTDGQIQLAEGGKVQIAGDSKIQTDGAEGRAASAGPSRKRSSITQIAEDGKEQNAGGKP